MNNCSLKPATKSFALREVANQPAPVAGGGLSGAIVTTSIAVTAGLAEIAAESIAMGLAGYMAAKSDAAPAGLSLIKGHLLARPLRGAIQTMLIARLAAVVASIARAIS